MWKEYRDKFITKMKNFFQQQYHKYICVKESSPYDDLSPMTNIEKVDPKGIYREGLDFATNNKNITNFAVTGPYGSGKSSLINSYIEYTGDKDKYLIISLSTFVNKESKVDDEPIINEIESSILEQIIYNNEEKSHQYSRLNRINAPKSKTLRNQFFRIGFLLLTLLPLFVDTFDLVLINVIDMIFGAFGGSFEGIFMINSAIFRMLLIVGILIGDAYIIFWLFKRIRYITKVTFNFGKTKLELTSTNGDSLLDKHIDEIYNFFKHNDYRVVVLEDLDRYDNIDIFERLKRINRLINSAKYFTDNNEKVKFLYTIGDHMFKNDDFKERTKFFDYVIPIVPVINTRNSYHEINKKFSNYPENQKPDIKLMKDVSFYIDDMRTLKNIVNEYKTYYKLLIDTNDAYFANKVFAIICFKNRYPSEFNDFQKSEGITIKLIKHIDKLRDTDTTELSRKIYGIENDLRDLPNELASEKQQVEDIFRMYMYRNITTSFFVYKQKTRIVNINSRDEIIRTSNFSKALEEGDTIVHNGRTESLEKYRTLGSTSPPYSKRIKMAELKSIEKQNVLMDELKKLRELRRISLYQNWNETLRSNSTEPEVIKYRNEFPLVFYFIYSGYLEKDYMRYIGFFKEGHMTNEDKAFISAIKIAQQLEYDFEISNPDEVLKEIVSEDLQSKCILNYFLFRYLLNGNDEKVGIILDALKSDITTIFDFVYGYMKWYMANDNTDGSAQQLVRETYIHVDTYWKYLFENESLIEVEEKSIHLFSLGATVDNKDFMKIESPNDSYVQKFIENSKQIKNVTEYIYEDVFLESINKLSKNGTIELKHLEYIYFDKNEANATFEYIYEESFYKLTSENINVILNRLNDDEKADYTLDELYAYLQNEKFESLKEDIEANATNFIEDCLDDYIENNYTSSDSFVYLLEVLCENLERKEKVILKFNTDTKIADLENVNSNIYQLLTNEKHVVPTYRNIKIYVNDLKYDQHLDKFISENIILFNEDAYNLDDDYDTLIAILKHTTNEKIIKMIKNIIGDSELVMTEFIDNKTTLIRLFSYGFRFLIDSEIVDEFNDDEEFLYEYLYYNTSSNSYKHDKLYISPEVTSKLGNNGIISGDYVYEIANWQIETYGDKIQYYENIAKKLVGESFIELIDIIDDKNIGLRLLGINITENDLSKEYILACLSAISDAYKAFTTSNTNFVLDYLTELEPVLKLIKGKGIISNYNIQDNGNVRVYMKRKSILNID